MHAWQLTTMEMERREFLVRSMRCLLGLTPANKSTKSL